MIFSVAIIVAVYLIGLGSGLLIHHLWYSRNNTRHPNLNQVLAASIFAAAIGASLLGVVSAWDARNTAECLVTANDNILSTLKGNTEVGALERQAMDEMLAKLTDPSQSSEEAIDEYIEARQKLENKRKDYPPLPKRECG